MLFKDRLIIAMEHRNVKASELAEKSGISKARISQYINGIYEPKIKGTYAIAKALDVNEAWLMGASIPMEPPKNSEQSLTELYPELIPIQPENIKKIPMLGEIACGEPIYREENEWVFLPDNIKADFGLKCVGDSMINARIYDGDIVFIQACPEVENGQIAAVSIDNEVTLKRVYYYPDKNKLVLYPENTLYEPFVYVNEELDDVRILGRAVMFLSSVK